MRDARAAAEAFRSRRPQDFPDGVRWSWDNAPWHGDAARALKLPARQRHTLPPNSPDMHKVVEHQHALIKREFRKRLTVQRDVDTPAKAAALLTSVVNDVVKKASVEADVCSLPATYCAIIEAGGGWPPAKYR